MRKRTNFTSHNFKCELHSKKRIERIHRTYQFSSFDSSIDTHFQYAKYTNDRQKSKRKRKTSCRFYKLIG